ncbi:hypothetical protein GCM10023094_09290 [Rhodococcus olei]|uniref:Uncharacterized protein n=1 Tax=Rhodococcus olei TaxID=2161675 RepID=A0ABP8NUV0_9NOCA
MGPPTHDRLGMRRRVPQSPQEITATRRETARIIAPFPREIRLCLEAGLEPPTD